MTLDEWRNVSVEELTPVLAAELARWRSELGWDATGVFDLLEAARREGRVPGFVARDEGGRIAGWTFFGLRRLTLQIGALSGQTGEYVRVLLDAVLRAPEADRATELLCFTFPESGSLESALARRRFTVSRFSYLRRPVEVPQSGPARRARRPLTFASWRDEDGPAAIRLIARAYVGQSSARCFAPRGTLEEWAQYLGQILQTPACGTLLPAASLVARDETETVVGAVFVTDLGPGTAHVAQIVVDPAARRLGLASELIERCSALVGQRGFHTVTLLVADDNLPARSLYARLGFEAHRQFVFARRPALRRVLGMQPAADEGAGDSVRVAAPGSGAA